MIRVKTIEVNEKLEDGFIEWFFEEQIGLWERGLDLVVEGSRDRYGVSAHLCILKTTIAEGFYIIEWDAVNGYEEGPSPMAKDIFYRAVDMVKVEKIEIADVIEWMVDQYKEDALHV